MDLAALREKLAEARIAARAGDIVATIHNLDLALRELAPQHLLTTTEAAELLGVRSVNTIKLWCRAGYLHGIQIGGRTMIPLSEVERIMGGDQVHMAQTLDTLHEDIEDFGTEAGLTDEQLQDLAASRPGKLPWQNRSMSVSNRKQDYKMFFPLLRSKLVEKAGFAVGGEVMSTSEKNWLSIGPYPDGDTAVGSLNFSFSNTDKRLGRPAGFRVEFHVDRGAANEKKRIRDILYAHRDEMPGDIGKQIEWDDTETRRSEKQDQRLAIYYNCPGPILRVTVEDRGEWSALIEWGVEKMIQLRAALDAV